MKEVNPLKDASDAMVLKKAMIAIVINGSIEEIDENIKTLIAAMESVDECDKAHRLAQLHHEILNVAIEFLHEVTDDLDDVKRAIE